MSMYISGERVVDNKIELLVVSDLYDANNQIIGERNYGWHPEELVTWNGLDISEDYMQTISDQYTVRIF